MQISRRHLSLTAAFVAMVAVSLTGCTSAEGDLETQCRQAVADHFDLAVADVVVTWNEETPGGSLDWRGHYKAGTSDIYGDPGTFACGAGLNPSELFQVIVITDDGSAEVVLL